MVFEYAATKTFMQAIDIVDIGNFCIKGTNQSYEEFYLAARTVMGKTSILSFGPILPDIPIFPEQYSLNYQKVDYKEKTICKAVSSFLNDPKKELTNVEEIIETEMWGALPDTQTYFENA